METADTLRILLSSVPYKLPIILVAIGGILFAVVNYSKNPPVSRRVIIGSGMMLTTEFFSLFMPLLTFYLYKNYGVQSGFAYIGYAVGFLLTIFSAIGLSLILWAVWSNRKTE